MSFKDLYEDVLGNIRELITCFDIQGTDQAEDFEDDIEFWLDSNIVLYNSELDGDQIEAASYGDIETDDEYLSLFLSEDIKRTYLSTQDLALIVGVNDDLAEFCVAVVDRSTGVAMINKSNIMDIESLQQSAMIAIENSKDRNNVQPIVRKYELILSPNSKLTKAQKDNSQRRLVAFLSDIDQYVLSRFLGKEVTAREDL